jgi:hypothetical protein
LDFLWPIRLDLTDNHVIVRFVVLEKNLSSYFDRPYLVSGRSAAKYKKAISSASEVMDEELGIKEHNPALYEILVDAMLRDTLFLIPADKGSSVSAVLIDPSNGRMAFPRYSERKGDTDAFIHAILQHNQ